MSVLSSLVLSLVPDEVICFDKRNPLDSLAVSKHMNSPCGEEIMLQWM